MDVEALREDALWTQGKQPRMAVRPSWVLALCDLADAVDKYIDEPSEETMTALARSRVQLEAV